MRGIADRLGAGTMSLYTHIPGKPALIELTIDTVAGQVYADLKEPSRQPGGWRDRSPSSPGRTGTGTCATLLQVLTGRPVLGPNINRKYEAASPTTRVDQPRTGPGDVDGPFRISARVPGRQAAGEYHQSAGDPAHSLEFGIERILDGVSVLIARSERP